MCSHTQTKTLIYYICQPFGSDTYGQRIQMLKLEDAQKTIDKGYIIKEEEWTTLLRRESTTYNLLSVIIDEYKTEYLGRTSQTATGISIGCAICGLPHLKGEPDQKLKCCSVCKVVHYCSRECQVKDWPNHKKFHS